MMLYVLGLLTCAVSSVWLIHEGLKSEPGVEYYLAILFSVTGLAMTVLGLGVIA